MNKINVGFIGLGRISDLHALGYKNNPEARIYGVSTRTKETGFARKKEWGAEKYYADYHDMLADPAIDAVEILTPQKLHEKMVLEAAAAGKHIMVQKPMTIDLASADRMLSAVKDLDKVYKVIENYIFYPPLRKAKELMDSGAIGEPINMRIKFISGSKGGWAIDPKTWEWRMQENIEGRGMQTFDHGHHMWCVAWYLMGDIDKVSAWIDSADGIVDCPANIIWKYKDGIRYGSCDYTHCWDMDMPSNYYANDEWFEITGSKGILLVNRCTGNLRTGPVLSHFNGSKWTHYDDLESDWGAGFRDATLNFISAIKGREAPLLTGEEAREILKIALAIIKSSKERREVYIDEFEEADPEKYAQQRRLQEIGKIKDRKGMTLDELKEKGRIL
ncbi:MAG: Gfo/Idh/MocA family oxidoreductase [Spirochaetales bacterium]|nr:Gfo/Idh/MocA family oxidoreductase [Spirochaetales bacterium]